MLKTALNFHLAGGWVLVIVLLAAACQKDKEIVEPAVNQPPVLLSATEMVGYADSLFTYSLLTDDPDGDPVTVVVDGLPAWLAYDEAVRELRGTPTREDAGMHDIGLQLSDGDTTLSAALRIEVIVPFSFHEHLLQIVEDGFTALTPGLAGVSVAVVQSDGTLNTARRGSSHYALNQPIKHFHQYRVASISKTFTAALIIRLAEEGYLSLDDRLIYHLRIPGLPFETEITIRQLLSHTAGVFDHLNSYVFWEDPYNTPTKVWTNEEIFQFAIDEGAYFMPGTGYAYSNTGFYILGAVAEEILQQPLAQIFEEWIFEPLGLDGTFYDDFSSAANPIPDLALSERAYDYHLSAAAAAGAIVSTPTDIARFGQALYGGDFIPPAFRAQMLENLGAMFGGSNYGLGTRLWFDQGIYHYGHTGSLMGYRGILMYVPEKGVSIAVHTNHEHPNWFGLVNHILVEVAEVL